MCFLSGMALRRGGEGSGTVAGRQCQGDRIADAAARRHLFAIAQDCNSSGLGRRVPIVCARFAPAEIGIYA
jgi:hypothetical protein